MSKLWKNTCNGIWDPTESLIEVSFYSPTYSGNSDPVGRIGKWNGVKTTTQAGKSGSCAANVQVVHSFVLDWRAEAAPDPQPEKAMTDVRTYPICIIISTDIMKVAQVLHIQELSI